MVKNNAPELSQIVLPWSAVGHAKADFPHHVGTIVRAFQSQTHLPKRANGISESHVLASELVIRTAADNFKSEEAQLPARAQSSRASSILQSGSDKVKSLISSDRDDAKDKLRELNEKMSAQIKSLKCKSKDAKSRLQEKLKKNSSDPKTRLN